MHRDGIVLECCLLGIGWPTNPHMERHFDAKLVAYLVINKWKNISTLK
jgi:hypothetical protein